MQGTEKDRILAVGALRIARSAYMVQMVTDCTVLHVI